MSVKNRIKEFIKNQNLTISAFENQIGASNGYVNSISKSIGASKLLEINRVFPNLDTDWLITGSGNMIKSDVVKEDRAEYLTNSNGNKFVEMQDGSMNVTVKVLPFKAYATYTEGIENCIPFEDFEEVTFNVDRYGMGNYQAFKVKGDSMDNRGINDTPDGSLVLARELGRQHWLDGFNETKYGWIILSKLNIFHKDIIGMNKDTGAIICHSRNTSPEYSDFELNLNDIYQIFKVIKRTF